MNLLLQVAACLALCLSAQPAAAAVFARDDIKSISTGSDRIAASPGGDAKPADSEVEALATTAALVFAALAGLAFAGRGRAEGT